MSANNGEYLYNLLPTVYRLRDHDQGEPLRALFAILEREWLAMRRDIDQLHDNWFIETCADWVIPYIGDLVGNQPLHEVQQLRRTDVAKTIYYRRRKGTLAMLEELARDVTGWGAHAVEFFQLLEWTQNLDHLRYRMADNPGAMHPNALDRVGTAHLRNGDAMDRVDGPFDIAAHTADLRPISRTQGWHNIPNIGFFLWRLRHYPLNGITARASTANSFGYHIGSLANPAPLFNDPEREADDSGLAGEIHLPVPIRPHAFYSDLAEYEHQYGGLPPVDRPANSLYYGPERSFHLIKDGTPVPPSDILCKDLSNWDRPPTGKVAVDVRLGRITFAAGDEPTTGLEAGATYGFSADTGGGPYERRGSLVDPAQVTLTLVVAQGTALDSLQEALTQWDLAGKPPARIQVADNGLYSGPLAINLPPQGLLVIEAANGRRPNLRTDGITCTAPVEGARLSFNGFLIEDALALHGNLHLTLRHCTLVPGLTLDEDGQPDAPDQNSLTVATPGEDLTVTLQDCISGPLRLPAACQGLTAQDSLIFTPWVADSRRPAIAADDTGAAPGPPTTLERVTLWGPVFVKELTLASEAIFNDPVRAQRQQVGCVRFSYLPPGSPSPRRYRCQPDLALSKLVLTKGLKSPGELTQAERDQVYARVQPEYTAERYGNPAFGQLSLTCAEDITTGAENGAEMGAFATLQQPQRAANLRLRLDEYLPFGLQAGLIYVT